MHAVAHRTSLTLFGRTCRYGVCNIDALSQARILMTVGWDDIAGCDEVHDKEKHHSCGHNGVANRHVPYCSDKHVLFIPIYQKCIKTD